MKVGMIDVVPIAAESLGVRSMCTRIVTPDIRLILDPSAALSRRNGLEPHPVEYRRLRETLERIFVEVRAADLVSISHYHFDHVRPGFTDFRYTFGSREELQRLFEGKRILAKDYRDHINASQRRRAYYFEKDLRGVAGEMVWADASRLEVGNTTITFSSPLPHGPDRTPLGFVLATTVEYDGTRVLFAPDLQGPVSDSSLKFILDTVPDLLIIGGPPTYLQQFAPHLRTARGNLIEIVARIPLVAVDHHLLRSMTWREWLAPVSEEAERNETDLKTLAALAGRSEDCLEARRRQLYDAMPPSEEFIDWTKATREYKMHHPPPL